MDSTAPILFVTSIDPWAQEHGALLRQRWIVRVLAEFAPVHLLFLDLSESMSPERGSRGSQLPDYVDRVVQLPSMREPLSLGDRWRWLQLDSTPIELSRRRPQSWSTSVREHVGDQEYRLCWYSRTGSFAAVSHLVSAQRSIIDIDDVEGSKRQQQLGLRFPAGQKLTPRDRLARWQGYRDARSWQAFEQQAAKSVDLAFVCHQSHVQAVGSPNVEVLPNTYPEPDEPKGKLEVDQPPTILLQGSLTYPPNVDGARFLVGEVLPRLRRHIPDVRVRLVGRVSDAVQNLHDPPRVAVTGFVESIEEELSLADVVAVPVRYGGGSRIKIIEAFAHGIPVVATRAGAAGLDSESGQNLLIADSPERFAEALHLLLADSTVRSRLREESSNYFKTKLTTEAGADLLRNYIIRVLH